MEFGNNHFIRIAHIIGKRDDFHQIVEDQESRLDLLSFQIGKLLPEQALKTYHRLQKKYESPNGQAIQPSAWLESQKRLFAWFVAFYTYLNQNQSQKHNQINFSQLSPSLFHKDPDFLLFHFLILCKSSERIGWSQQDDQLLLDAISQEGMKWSEISRIIFMKTEKLVFKSPKSCRQRWLNHLDNTKIKGNWEDAQDIAIFQHVVETSSKKWSKMVNILGNKRTEHSIKNRFNALIAKHRRYKCQKDLKVAARILTYLQNKSKAIAQSKIQSYDQNQQSEIAVEVKTIFQNEAKSQDCRDDSIKDINNVNLEVKQSKQPSLERSNPQLQKKEVVIKQQEGRQLQAPIPEQQQREAYQDAFYPFENYSYEQDLYTYNPQVFDFHPTQLFYYPQMITFAIPTADTITRQARILQERNRRANNANQGNHY